MNLQSPLQVQYRESAVAASGSASTFKNVLERACDVIRNSATPVVALFTRPRSTAVLLLLLLLLLALAFAFALNAGSLAKNAPQPDAVWIHRAQALNGLAQHVIAEPGRANARTNGRKNERTNKRTNQRTNERTNQRTNEQHGSKPSQTEGERKRSA
jgi:hypothetical protein